MFDAGTIIGKLILDKGQWTASVKEVGEQEKWLKEWTGQTEKEVNKLGDTVSKGGLKISGLWKQVAIGMGVGWGASKAIRLLKDTISDTIKASSLAEDAENALAASLELTGKNAEMSIEHFRNLAEAIMWKTRYTDEDIKSTQSLLIQLTDLDQKGIDRATRGAIGLASVFKVDLATAGELVAKAMTGNVGAITRYIGKIDESLTEDQKRVWIMEKLEALYMRAEREMDTYSGVVAQNKTAWGELKEVLGEAITKNEFIKGLIKDSTEAIKDQIPKVKEAVGEWNLYWSAVAEGLKGGKETWPKETVDRIKAEIKWVDMMGEEYVENIAKLARWREERGKILAVPLSKPLKDDSIEAQALAKQLGIITKIDVEKTLRGFSEALFLLKGKLTTKEEEKYRQKIEELETELRPIPFDFDQIGYSIKHLKESKPDKLWEMLFPPKDLKTEIDEVNAALDKIKAGLDEIDTEKPGKELSNFEQMIESFTMTLEDLTMATIASWMTCEATLKGFIEAAVEELEIYCAAQALKWVFENIPWPWSLLVAAGAIASVRAIFEGLVLKKFPVKFAEGAVFEKPTFIQGIAGEAGREYLLPEPTLREFSKEIIHENYPQSRRPINVHVHTHLGGTEVGREIIQIIEKASYEGRVRFSAKVIQ